jgi:uncharacterized damage-inducible protein DinB
MATTPPDLCPEAKAILAGLEFRRPSLLGYLEQASDAEFYWRPPGGGNSVAWQLWHISEVEDNWVRRHVLAEPPAFAFGVSVKHAAWTAFPARAELLGYFERVRESSRQRLAAIHALDFNREVVDDHFGTITLRDVWAGVVTSFAWHAGQVPLTLRLARALG